MPLGVLWLLAVGVAILRLDLYFAGVAALIVVTAAARRTVGQSNFNRVA